MDPRPTAQTLPVTRIVDALLDCGRANALTDNYLYFDPKLVGKAGPVPVPRSRAPFTDAIVFVVGGGNYIEYQNLRDYCARSATGSSSALAAASHARRVVYGATELVAPSQFLAQLARLGGGASTPDAAS